MNTGYPKPRLLRGFPYDAILNGSSRRHFSFLSVQVLNHYNNTSRPAILNLRSAMIKQGSDETVKSLRRDISLGCGKGDVNIMHGSVVG